MQAIIWTSWPDPCTIICRDPAPYRSDRMFTRVCKEETVPEGGWRLVIADAQLIVLAWPENGVMKAYQGVCPHANSPLAEAEFDGTVLTCPLHRWNWDLNTGAPIHE